MVFPVGFFNFFEYQDLSQFNQFVPRQFCHQTLFEVSQAVFVVSSLQKELELFRGTVYAYPFLFENGVFFLVWPIVENGPILSGKIHSTVKMLYSFE